MTHKPTIQYLDKLLSLKGSSDIHKSLTSHNSLYGSTLIKLNLPHRIFMLYKFNDNELTAHSSRFEWRKW
jgi:hypothetical protein